MHPDYTANAAFAESLMRQQHMKKDDIVAKAIEWQIILTGV
jgi:hypothetical protein